MFSNLTGWHVLIILAVLLLLAAAVIVVVVLLVVNARKSATLAAPDHRSQAPVVQQPTASDPIEQIRQLGELKDQGLLSQAEFEAKRNELLGRL
ncbi:MULTISPECIES: SHOCT domain-containing protein [unclassified Leifsonia]|uniref:SHOCT domain-containing protein n=1 Tax=unclassified Leifsonia TaxID=2663824 RepID=UPI0006F7CDBF|nr:MULTISPECIES: SHOCT domain-containing protein [unclassified Leifsonia]KQX07771.1 hypothetical protein ASC59_08570 [Leifsonia sp. Root1293]KRA12053.1 hypothetical protein ASD61_08570 [Leifsonia sp. Root60]